MGGPLILDQLNYLKFKLLSLLGLNGIHTARLILYFIVSQPTFSELE